MLSSALIVAFSIHPQLLPQQHKWAPLVSTASAQIEIDTASIAVFGPRIRRVWLRWDLSAAAGATFGPGYRPQYELELRDLDCGANRTRTVQKRQEVPKQTRGAGVSLSATEASWQAPGQGSLLATVLDAACRFTKAGA